MKIKLGNPSNETQAAAAKVELSDSQWAELESMLENGNKLAAIKQVREWQSCSLLQAKTLVEEHHANLCKLDPQRFGNVSASGCGANAGMFLLAAMLGSGWAMWS